MWCAPPLMPLLRHPLLSAANARGSREGIACLAGEVSRRMGNTHDFESGSSWSEHCKSCWQGSGGMSDIGVLHVVKIFPEAVLVERQYCGGSLCRILSNLRGVCGFLGEASM